MFSNFPPDNLASPSPKEFIPKRKSASPPNKGGEATDLLMIGKYFERIGDHATNIAEWAIYSVQGDINVVQ